MKKLLTFCLIGTVLEWYDFALFGALSPFLSTIFFPHETQSVALILMLAIFTTGFVMRPLGAIFFGHIGDKYGRKKAIILSVMMMTGSTVIIGSLPIIPNHTLFIVVTLAALRMLQGFSASGELGGVNSFLSETLKEDKRFFFYMSLTGSSQVGGVLLGSIIGGIAFSLSSQYTFSWRIPFLLSFLLGIVGVYLRIKAIETPIFKKMVENKSLTKIPLVTVFKYNKRLILLVVIIGIATSIATYFIALSYPFYVKSIYGKRSFFEAQIIMLSIATIISPFLSLLVTRKNIITFTAGSLLMVGIAVVLLIWIDGQNSSLLIMLLIGACYALFYTPLRSVISTTICLLFPNNVRYTGIGLASNLAVLLGGSFPLLSTTLTRETGSLLDSGIMMSILAFISATVLFSVRHKVEVM